MWQQPFSIEVLNKTALVNLPRHLGIEFIDFGEEFLRARMPVDERTQQPFGLLHGGASAALAETLGSVASVLCIEDISTHQPVGIELNANHLHSATRGFVIGTVRPLRVGRRMHVWEIKIEDEEGTLICASRLTVMVVARRTPA